MKYKDMPKNKWPQNIKRASRNSDVVFAPCANCGERTRFAEVPSFTRFCSEECRRAFHERREKEASQLPKVVLVEPDKPARVVEMDLSLESMQKTVSGLIQAVYPWEDKVALVCNDEGKLLNLPENRALEDEKGNVYDIVCGTFFICGLTDDNFGGLTDEQADLYLKKFRNPQKFMTTNTGKLLIVTECRDFREGK